MASNSVSVFLGSRLRALREKHGLTQESYAHLAGLDYKYYQFLEAGKKDVRISMLERLAKVYGIDGCDILAKLLPETSVQAPAHSAPHKQRRNKS